MPEEERTVAAKDKPSPAESLVPDISDMLQHIEVPPER